MGLHVLAEGTADVLQWLSIPAWVTGLGVPLALWLRGTLLLRSDHDKAMAAQRQTCDAELAAEVQQRKALQDRIDHLVPDRDAWREAHAEAQRALQASERAAAALMETGQISLALLGALKDALAGREKAGG